MRLSTIAIVLALTSGCSDAATPPSMSAGGAGGSAAQVGAGSAGGGAGGGGAASGGTTTTAGTGGSVASVAGSAGTAAGAAGGGAGGGAGTGGRAGASANPEGVPPDYTLFIDQSFAEPASLAELRFANPADWVHQAADGGYLEATAASYAPPHASLHALAMFGSLKFGAFVLEAEILQTNPSGGHRDFCVAWGIESPSRYYYAHIAQAHDAVAHNIHIVLDADRTAITTSFVDGFDWGTDVWHKFRVTRSAAGEMSVSADGAASPLLVASDVRLGAGYIGFGSFDDKGKVRNVKLWAPSAEEAPAAFFTAK